MPRLKSLSAAIMVLMAPSTGWVAEAVVIDNGLDWSQCASALEVSLSENDAQFIRLEADAVKLFTDKKLLHLSGNVVARQGDLEVKAQRLEYHEPTGRIEAEGYVFFKSPGIRLTGNNASFDLAVGQAIMHDAAYRLPQQRVRGHAKKIELLDPSRVQMEGIRYTTCAPGDNGWLLQADKLEIDRDKGIGEARGAMLAFQGVPFFYTPYLQFPIDDRRMTGLLMPSIRYSNRVGLDVSVPYYFNISPNMDATFQPRLMGKRGLMLGGEVRYKSSNTYSDLEIEWIADDSGLGSNQLLEINRSRGAVGFEGKGFLPGKGKYKIDYSYVSDQDYLDDFGDSLAVTAKTHLRRRADVTYLGKDWRLLGRLDYFQTIDEAIAAKNRPYARLPQLLYRVKKSDPWYGFQFDFRGEYVYFDRDSGVTGHRVDLTPAVTYPLESVWGFLRPRVSMRQTSYELKNLSAGEDATPSRTLPTLSVDGGLYFERSGNWFGQAITHVLEPRLFYLRTPYRQQSSLPDFDTGLTSFRFSSLFKENRFTGADRVGDANQLAVALSSRILDNDTGDERLRVGLGSIFYFDDRKVQLASSGVSEESSSAVVGEVAVKILDRWSLQAGVQWDPNQQKAERSGVQLSWKADEDRLFNLSYRSFRGGANRNVWFELADVSFKMPVNETVNLVGRWNYSLREKETMEVFGGIEYETCCWAVRAVARRHVNEAGEEPDSSFLFQLELKGMGGIGNKLGDFLERGILGYEVDR